MAERKEGIILNISSMTAFRPLTRMVGLLRRKGGGEQFHAVAGGAHGAGVFAEHPRQRHRAGILPDRTEPVPADRQGDRER